MTPRENLSLLVAGKSPQWIPFTMDIGASGGFTTAIQRRFSEETGAADPAEYFNYDLRTVSVERSFGNDDARRWHPLAPEGTQFDEWGIGHWAGGAEDTLERMFPPFAGMTDVRRDRGVSAARHRRRGGPARGSPGTTSAVTP